MTVTRRRAQAGIALVMVLVLLGGLLVVALPFAFSMRHLHGSAQLELGQARARAGALAAIGAARRHLEDTHPMYDLDSPHRDDLEEIAPRALAERFEDLLPTDPRGDIRSVSVADESGRVDLTTASPYLLGNLLGGRARLTAPVAPDGTVLPVSTTEGFPPAGLLWVGREVVEYSRVREASLEECRRGFSGLGLPRSRAASHRLGEPVLDGRLLLLLRHGWSVRPGTFETFRRVEGLKDIALYGELAYTARELERARDDLTVHGVLSPAHRFVDTQPVLGTQTDLDGHVGLLVRDGSGYGAGTVVEIETGAGRREWGLSLGAIDRGDGWHVSLLEDPALRHGGGGSVLRRLRRVPVNVNTCSQRVLVALLEGVGPAPVRDVLTAREAALVAPILVALAQDGTRIEADDVQRRLRAEHGPGALSSADVRVATAIASGPRAAAEMGVELPELLAGARGALDVAALGAEALAELLSGAVDVRPVAPVGPAAAAELARRVREAGPGSHETLRGVLDEAVSEGVCSPEQRDALLRNALDAGDAAISGGTAPFAYASAGLFTIEAAASHNLPNGRERARAFARQTLSVAPPSHTLRELSTQRGLERGVVLGEGWTSGPRLLRSGPGRAPVATTPQAPRVLLDPAEALNLASRPARRAHALVSGRPGPAGPQSGAWLAPATVRSALPDTIHFDEGVQGFTARGPRGLSFADASLDLRPEAIRPSLFRSDGLLQPFGFELWFEVEDVTARTVLFDAGADALEDRVLLMLDDGELVLRVADTGIPDFEAVVPEGRLPPAGEIRYAFDDGLALQPDTPYHVFAYVGGARDTSLMLFVDGVPRGRRSFTTYLVEDVPAAGSVAAGEQGTEIALRVGSTAGFPRTGALRVGREVMEYVDVTDDAFLVRSAEGVDPFGGRGRRTTRAAEHPAGELVELLGYTRPVFSERVATGRGTLGSLLGAFDLAEVDPGPLEETIEIELDFGTVDPNAPPGSATTFTVGTGLLPTTVDVPLLGLGGDPIEEGVFQETGGYALLFCDYGGLLEADVSNPDGGPFTLAFPNRTSTGDPIGGAELIRYEGFDGSMLTGCTRGAAAVSGSLLDRMPQDEVVPNAEPFGEPRAFITTFDPALPDLVTPVTLPEAHRVLVVPLSVGVGVGIDADDWLPEPSRGPGEGVGAPRVQIDLDFAEGADATEWVAYDSIFDAFFVRDDSERVLDTMRLLEEEGYWVADPREEVDLDAVDEELRFRGRDGTSDGEHAGGAQVLPVHVLGGHGTQYLTSRDVLGGAPGRRDAITFVSPDDGTKEWHRINWADVSADGWGSAYALIGLRDAVEGEFVRTEREGLETPIGDGSRRTEALVSSSSEARTALERLNRDARQITRVVKAPSGELPSVAPPAVHLGRDHTGLASPGVARIDELRFHAPRVAGPMGPATARLRLVEELEFEETRRLRLDVDGIVTPFGARESTLLGEDALEVLSELPQAGGLLLVGEEIVGFAGLDPTDTGHVFITERGMYGTRQAYHGPQEAVVPLAFWPASPLASRLGEDAAALPVADAAGFPAGGGLLLVGGELVEYTSVAGGALRMPVAAGTRGRGLLRGRFGTTPGSHPAGTMVRWMPARHRDRALLGQGGPWSQPARARVTALGAVFTEVGWSVSLPDPRVGLAWRAVLDGRHNPHEDATLREGLFAFAAPGAQTGTLRAAGDVLDLYAFATWAPGAFDPEGYAAQGWKQAPRVHAVVVGHAQPHVVLEHEEW